MQQTTRREWLSRLLALGMACAFCMAAFSASAAAEQTFDVLQIGTQVYSNVTVTTKTKTYVFLLHSAGMANVKVSDLSPELKEKLGYGVAASLQKGAVGEATHWAETKLKKLEIPEIVQARSLKEESASRLEQVKALPRWQLIAAGAVLLLLWLIRCGCQAVICQKAGSPPGALIWLPIVKLIPLLRAAKMSLGWLVLLLLPPAYILVDIIWSFKIAAARGKTPLTGLCLALPGLSVLAFFYLVVSNGKQAEKPKRSTGNRVLTLETA
ncbi:MAG TPA: hypothetical protein VHH88_07105 [Verrucomicrobiae bacterium]|nr:hypothetical protein [Verrucomicrobiae bacterium]